jgi:hypothetical protein
MILHHMAVHDFKTLRRLHPAIGRENPEGRDQGADRDHQGGAEVGAWTHALPAEQHDAEEARFEEERGHHFVHQQRSGDRSGETGKARPVGAELIAHHDAGDDAHTEGDCEDLRPEQAKIFVVRLAGFQPAPFKDGDEAGEADAERRKNNVERNGERKLNAGEIECRDCGVHEREVA